MILNLHIPFCIAPEKYIRHFNAVGTNEQKNLYLQAMMKEVQSYEGDLDDYEIQAVRLGGGSATVMKPDLLGKLLNQVRHTLPVARGAEVSFDAQHDRDTVFDRHCFRASNPGGSDDAFGK